LIRLKKSTDLATLPREAIMMPSSTTPATGEAGRRTGSHGYGWVLFASILLFVTGCSNMIQGIAAVAGSDVFPAHAHYVFANLTTWGWVTAVLGALQLVAAAGVLAANQMLFIPAYPFWSLTIIAMDVVALYGLCVYGSREDITAV
jgi:hypothetical protein